MNTLAEDIRVLIQFWDKIKLDKKGLESFSISKSLDSVLETPNEHSSLPSVSDSSQYDNTRYGSAGQGWLNLQPSTGCEFDVEYL